jgi:hypothetical protein
MIDASQLRPLMVVRSHHSRLKYKEIVIARNGANGWRRLTYPELGEIGNAYHYHDKDLLAFLNRHNCEIIGHFDYKPLEEPQRYQKGRRWIGRLGS